MLSCNQIHELSVGKHLARRAPMSPQTDNYGCVRRSLLNSRGNLHAIGTRPAEVHNGSLRGMNSRILYKRISVGKRFYFPTGRGKDFASLSQRGPVVIQDTDDPKVRVFGFNHVVQALAQIRLGLASTARE